MIDDINGVKEIWIKSKVVKRITSEIDGNWYAIIRL